MKTQPKRIFRKTIAMTALFCLTTQSTFANLLSLSPVPLTVSSVPPQVMLTITKDQQLFKKAYNDYSDLNNDNRIDRTYDHRIEYYGYFDPFKCYDYKDGIFEPKNYAATKTTITVNGLPVDKYLPALCKSSLWNGNFLNWVSMTRMDAVRKLLYGGLRYVDETFDKVTRPVPVTVLERAYLPTDAHAWAKHYLPDAKYSDGNKPPADPALPWQPAIDDLTPFKPETNPVSKNRKTTSTRSFPVTAGVADFSWDFDSVVNHILPGDQVRIQKKDDKANYFLATIRDITNSAKTVHFRVQTKGIVGTATSDEWDVINLSSTGISFCNLTVGVPTAGDVNEKSQTNLNPPIIRVAEGNFGLWNANERAQCHWFEEASNRQSGFAAGTRSNGNQSAVSGIDASAENPIQAVHGSKKGTEFIVRVKVCVPGKDTYDRFINAEGCKTYPNGNLKPIGLLQQYGDDERFHFGLMTGSYAKNVSGGVLRKNIGKLTDEVRVESDGAFRERKYGADGITFTDREHPYRPRPWTALVPGTRTAASEESPPGIINTLNYMRIYGYRYFKNGTNLDGDYKGADADNCEPQRISIDENACTSWGNPISEMFFEAVRYFAGAPNVATPAYTFTNKDSKDNLLGLPLAPFKDPLNTDNYCAPLNLLVFNAAVADNELEDEEKKQADLRTVLGTDINAAGKTLAALTNAVGDHEKITGGQTVGKYFVGKIVGTTQTTDGDYELCSPKEVKALGDVGGICPEGPTAGGSYLISGIAHHAKTNRIRKSPSPLMASTDARSLKVTTYGVQLASNTPQLEIDVSPNADGSQRMVIQPIYRLDRQKAQSAPTGPGKVGGGGLVDMRYVGPLVTTGNLRSGKVYVNWEDSEQGGDYDQDMWGTIEWSVDVSTGKVTVTTNAVSASTANPQGFGYSISGTDNDGPHFFSGIYGFEYTFTKQDGTKVKECTNCRLAGEPRFKKDPLQPWLMENDPPPGPGAVPQAGEQKVSYQITTKNAAGKLNDPLWYAAKYGGFTDVQKIGNIDNLPDAGEWDRENNLTGETVPDGMPDNYFLVTNPLGLKAALTRAFNNLGKNTSGSAVMANSTSLSTTNKIYQARYETTDWHGQLLSKTVNPDTGAITVESDDFEAGELLNARCTAGLCNATGTDSRVVLTFDDRKKERTGIPFRKDQVSKTSLKDLLNISPLTESDDGKGDERLLYLRGDQSRELNKGGAFRQRGSVLGDIVNSDPAYVGIPNAAQVDSEYGKFRTKYFSRNAMLYVGANDGMLHGFDAVSGKERLAYVPSKTFPHLAKLTSPVYAHRYYVDGAPQTADVQLGTTEEWRTVLVGGLGGGGQGLYALDVTNPGIGKDDSGDFTEANADKLVLWEFTDADDPDLGYVYGKPVIRKMANGKWAAILSSGYNNSEGDGAIGTGKAYLFIIFLNGPTGADRKWEEKNGDYVKIEATMSEGGPVITKANGLAPPFAADTDADGIVNFVYAGDLQGFFWKFDVSNNDTKLWNDRKLILFHAVDGEGNDQPITSQAEGTLHPTLPGFLLAFGTGKYLEMKDTLPKFAIQSYYGIWDKNDGTTVVKDRQNELFGYEIKLSEEGFRVIVPEDPSLKDTATPDWTKHLGWRMDFPNSNKTGERVVFRPLLMSSRLIFTTLIPSEDPCAGGGTSFLMIVDPTTGGRINAAVINTTTGDKVLNNDDKVSVTFGSTGKVFASGVASGVGIAPTPVVVKGGPTTGVIGAPASTIYGTKAPAIVGSGPESLLGYTFLGGPLGIEGLWIGLKASSGRVSWREVLPTP